MHNRNRRSSSSLSGRQSSVVSAAEEVFVEPYEQLEKPYAAVRRFLRDLYKRRENHLPQEDLKLLCNQMQEGKERFRKTFQGCQRKLDHLTKQLDELKKDKRNLLQLHQQQLRTIESEVNRQLYEQNREFKQKQQVYSDLISKFMNSLTTARNNWKRIYEAIQTKCDRLITVVQHYKQNFDQNKHLSAAIVDLVSELNLRKEQDSLCSRNLETSSGFILDNSPQNQKHMQDHYFSRKNHLDYSSIEIRQQNEQFQQSQIQQHETGFQISVDCCLIKLIYCGIFAPQNRQKIMRMIDISESLHEDYKQLINHALFPLLVDILKSKEKSFEEAIKNCELNQENLTEDQSSFYEGKIELRDVQKLQDISFAQQSCQQRRQLGNPKFKKKKNQCL